MFSIQWTVFFPSIISTSISFLARKLMMNICMNHPFWTIVCTIFFSSVLKLGKCQSIKLWYSLAWLWHFALRFTISTLRNMTDNMVLIDVNDGRQIHLQSEDVFWILGIGWIASFIALVLNIVYYNLHPSAVDFSIGRFRKRIVLYVCGIRFFKKGTINFFSNSSYIHLCIRWR